MRPQLFGPLWAVVVILAALAVLASALPATSALADLDSDYVIPSWEVAPYPGAAPILLNGTAEQVYAKLLEMNPNYDDDWKNEDDTNIDIDIDIDNNTALDVELERREVEQDIHCWRDEGVQKKYLRSGIKYLRKVRGRPYLPPKKCSRVSCSYLSAIEWCNDREHDDFYLPSFNNIADGAQVILNICGKDSERIKGWLGHGDDKWRVNVFYLGEVAHHPWC
ncbi:hypothetical protein BJX68DRAFT_273587 [Aspergillus pseudodeflectus]|uniref:Secreted protein n=1 Tax=Aspergillus pseudodeflectus TaxID=176178 RepID=A0ABR4J8S2_9EURO